MCTLKKLTIKRLDLTKTNKNDVGSKKAGSWPVSCPKQNRKQEMERKRSATDLDRVETLEKFHRLSQHDYTSF